MRLFNFIFIVGVIFSFLILSASVSSDGQFERVLDCSLILDGEEHQAVMMTSVGRVAEILVTGLGECHLSLLVMGGGGHGQSGGAGSGHLEYRSLQVAPGTVLTARVGDKREASNLAISDGEWVTALPGQDGHFTVNSDGTSSYDGGTGYSGGGGYGFGDPSGGGSEDPSGGDGGCDGGDGETGTSGTGGRGTGEDVSLYTFTTWSLAPGAGGEVYYLFYGGGGGGVMVDGAGPEASQYQGQGYGGGGNGYPDYGDGLPGLILLEIN